MIERRFVKGAEVRATKEGDKPQIGGYASVFGEEYVLYDGASYRVVEKIKEGAFARALKEKQDVRCLFNHNPDNVLGRSTSGTLRMSQDSKGLKFDNDLDTRTTIAQNVQAYIERGDVTGCSFAFDVSKQSWSEETRDGKTISTRVIEEIGNLYDVGPVTYPAYEGTSVAARSWLAGAPAEIRSAVTKRDGPVGTPSNTCQCTCAECQAGDCDNCSDPDCEEMGCDHMSDDDGDERERILADIDARMRIAGLKPTA